MWHPTAHSLFCLGGNWLIWHHVFQIAVLFCDEPRFAGWQLWLACALMGVQYFGASAYRNVSECNIIASAGLLRPAGSVRQNKVEELKISSKVLWKAAKLQVCQIGSHILEMVATKAWTGPRGESSVDTQHADWTIKAVLKWSQRQPMHAGSNPLPRRMLCYVAPQLLPEWWGASASAPCWWLPYSPESSMEKLKCQNILFLLGIKSYNHWPVMPLPFLSFSLFLFSHLLPLLPIPALMHCCSLAEP